MPAGRRSSRRTACTGRGDLDELVDTLELLRHGPPGPAAPPGSRPCTTPAPSGCWSPTSRAARACRSHRCPTTTATRLAAARPGAGGRQPARRVGPRRRHRAAVRRLPSRARRRPAVAVVALAVDLVQEYDGDDSYPRAVLGRLATHIDKPLAVLANLAVRGRPGAGRGLRATSASRCSRARAPVSARSVTCWRRRSASRRSSRVDHRPPRALAGAAGSPAARAARPARRLRRSPASTRRRSAARRRSPRLSECGYPVVLKTAEPRRRHKIDVGGVLLGLDYAAPLSRRRTTSWRRLGPRVVVQPQVQARGRGRARSGARPAARPAGGGGGRRQLGRGARRARGRAAARSTRAARRTRRAPCYAAAYGPVMDSRRRPAVIDHVVAVARIAAAYGDSLAATRRQPAGRSPDRPRRRRRPHPPASRAELSGPRCSGNGSAIGSAASRLRPDARRTGPSRGRSRRRTSVRTVQHQVGRGPGDSRSPHHPVATGAETKAPRTAPEGAAAAR